MRSSFRVSRLMLAAAALVASSFVTQPLRAQSSQSVDVRLISGGLFATGDLGDDITDAGLFGAQVGWQFHRNWGVVGTFAWVPSGSVRLAPNQHLDLYQYDAGIEGRLPEATSFAGFDLSPFAGIGAGARTYSLRRNGDSDTRFDGYGALGFEAARGGSPFALRIEARDNVSSYRGLQGAASESNTRNDVTVFAGLGYRFR